MFEPGPIYFANPGLSCSYGLWDWSAFTGDYSRSEETASGLCFVEGEWLRYDFISVWNGANQIFFFFFVNYRYSIRLLPFKPYRIRTKS